MKLKKLESKCKTSNNGKLLVISGPSGAGKGTVVTELIRRMPEIVLSISATTRAPRIGEQDGINYFFVTKEQFVDMIRDNELLEYDQHFDNYYGTPKKFVFDNLIKGNNVLLEIDIKGAMQVQSVCPEAKLFFVQAPSIEELRNRLVSRNSETTEQIAIRMSRVENEMKQKDAYDYVVTNDTVDNAVNQIMQIIKEMN